MQDACLIFLSHLSYITVTHLGLAKVTDTNDSKITFEL